jgi:two-component system response regulator FixJ
MKNLRSGTDPPVARLPGFTDSGASGSRWIAVVADDAGVRELIVNTLEFAGYVVREAGSAEEALELMSGDRPAFVIADIALPGRSGYELWQLLRERFGDALPIVLISGVRAEQFEVMADFLLGADDFIAKPFEPSDVVVRVHRALARSAASSTGSSSEDCDLTAREREVLSLLAEGFSQKEIAAHLVICSTTVATHIQRILSKLHVHSRTEAVAWAYRTGVFRNGSGAR